jgi:hypothetical protein
VVYENGIRQQNATVEVEHAPVSLGLLIEFGGRTPALNRELGQEVSRAGEHLVDELSRGDRLAVWKYDDRVEKVSDFSQNHEALDTFFLKRYSRAVGDKSIRRYYLHPGADATRELAQSDSPDLVRYRYPQQPVTTTSLENS